MSTFSRFDRMFFTLNSCGVRFFDLEMPQGDDDAARVRSVMTKIPTTLQPRSRIIEDCVRHVGCTRPSRVANKESEKHRHTQTQAHKRSDFPERAIWQMWVYYLS